MLNEKTLVTLAKAIDTDIEPREALIAAGIESADESTRELVLQNIETLEDNIRSTLEAEQIQVDDITLDLVKKALIANKAPLEALKASSNGAKASLESDGVVIDTSVIGEADFLPRAAIESFDAASTEPKEKFAVMLTAASAKQDEALELFFPTIPVDAFSSAATVTVRLVQVMNSFKRPLDAAGNKFNKIPLIKAASNPDIIDITKNELRPVYRPEAADLLVAEGRHKEIVGGEETEVAPVKFGREINLLTLGATDAMLSRGALTDEDALDPRVQILSVVYQLTGKDSAGNEVTETFKFDLEGADVTFAPSPTGHEKKSLVLNTTLVSTIDTTNTRTINGGESAILSALPQGYIAKIQYELSGRGDTQTGNIVVDLLRPTLEGVYTNSGMKLSTSDETYAKIKAVTDTFKALGYEVRGYTTNSNARVDGVILTSDGYTAIYNFAYRTGATVKYPIVNNGEAGDANAAIDIAKGIIFKINASGFKTLHNFVNYMKNNGEEVNLKGVTNKFLTKGFVYDTLDMKEIVDGIESSNRERDIAGALLAKIRFAANKLLYHTNYGAALDIEMPGVKPTLLIVTDNMIGAYLSSIIDELSTEAFDVRFATTYNQSMRGKIIFSFGVFDGNRNKAPNPFNFGQLFRAPDLVIPVVSTQSGSTAVRNTVMPKYLHVVNIPIIGEFEVTGLEDVLKKLTINMQTV